VIKTIFDLLRRQFQNGARIKHRLAAALAYTVSRWQCYIIVIAIAGSVFGEEAARAKLDKFKA